jgi:protein-disulfide isomerase
MIDPEDHVDGPPDAPLELVMYGDFQCPYCAAAQGILRRVRDRLDGRLRFVYRHFPLDALHPDARRAAEASEAAAAQGFFWEMHDALFGLRGQLAQPDILRAAGAIRGLDVDRMRVEIESGAHAERVQRDVASGTELGVPGTPTFFVNGVRHAGAFDAQALIAALEGRDAA